MATFLPRVGAELREDALTIILIIVDPKVVLSDLLPQGKEGGLTSLVGGNDRDLVPEGR